MDTGKAHETNQKTNQVEGNSAITNGDSIIWTRKVHINALGEELVTFDRQSENTSLEKVK